MAQIKKNQLANILFAMVDATDFASIESGITASDFNSAATKKFYGVTHGNSTAFTSGTISKATTLVRSGIFQQTLKTTETNYDYLLVRFTHPSCADQLLVFHCADYDDSDMYSQLSDIGSNLLSYMTGLSATLSDVDSQLLLNASMISDAYSLISDVDSQLLLTHSLLSDVESQVDLLATSNYLSQIYSDLNSQIGGVSIDASDISDIASRVWSEKYTAHSAASSFGSLFSDVYSRIVLIQSNVSDIDSQLLITHSLLSDVESQVDLLATSEYLSQIHSDLTSQISNITCSLDYSDISDIASAVWADAVGSRVDSRILVIQSNLSDVESQVDLLATSDYLSQVHVDLRSHVGSMTAAVTASDMSDIASRVWATTEGTRVDSRVLLIQSAVSDVDSQLLITHSLLSDVESQVDLLVTSNYLSQVHSDLNSQIGGITASITASDISDIASRVWSEKYTAHSAASSFGSLFSDVYSRVVLIQSNVSDVDSQLLVTHSLLSDVESQVDLLATSDYLSQVHSDLVSAIGAVTTSITASDMSDIASQVWATTEGTRVDSRILVLQSNLSDVESQVDLLATSNYLSQVHSDLGSQIGGITATVGASDISDIASAVWADTIGARVDSRILVIQSNVSDVESQIDAGLSISASDMSDISSRVWAEGTRTLTQSAASVASAVSGDDITILRGDTLSASITGLGDISARSKLWFTVKRTEEDADADSIIQIEETGGLLYLNGAAYATAAHGSITVTDEAAGDLTIAMDEVATVLLAVNPGLVYDIQMLDTSGDVTTLCSTGAAIVTADVTRAIT